MRLVLGGSHQGKLHFVYKKYGEDAHVLNSLHIYVMDAMKNGEDVMKKLDALIKEQPDIIIIGNEIGSGLVPVSQEDRDFRDVYGNVLERLAKKAESVERIICGLEQKLK